jgi:hypothetical protein
MNDLTLLDGAELRAVLLALWPQGAKRIVRAVREGFIKTHRRPDGERVYSWAEIKTWL